MLKCYFICFCSLYCGFFDKLFKLKIMIKLPKKGSVKEFDNLKLQAITQ